LLDERGSEGWEESPEAEKPHLLQISSVYIAKALAQVRGFLLRNIVLA